MTKTVIAIWKWAWHYYSGEREYFEKHGDAWVCTRCGGVE